VPVCGRRYGVVEQVGAQLVPRSIHVVGDEYGGRRRHIQVRRGCGSLRDPHVEPQGEHQGRLSSAVLAVTPSDYN
jgi:hypothetical protein